MQATGVGEVLDGLWRFEATHPEWTEDEGGEEGWEPEVAWWALRTPAGLLLVDPLVTDWQRLDRLLAEAGGCAGVVRTLHWHQRSVPEVAARYGAQVWARRPAGEAGREPVHRPVEDGDELAGGIRVIDVERTDEIALWLPGQQALLFGDAMLRRETGELRVCPESWLQPDGGRARLTAVLRGLTSLPVEHVLVSHGPLVLGDGLSSLAAATDDASR
jgi:glyoxylase-like metal-dependent hydrolase (beta-lactamase superfamily II)